MTIKTTILPIDVAKANEDYDKVQGNYCCCCVVFQAARRVGIDVTRVTASFAWTERGKYILAGNAQRVTAAAKKDWPRFVGTEIELIPA